MTRALRSRTMPGMIKRVLGIVVATAVLCGLVVSSVSWLSDEPPRVASAATAGGPAADLTLQTVASLGSRYQNPDWVSYLVDDPERGWTHSTNLEVPSSSLVQVTILQCDSANGSETRTSRVYWGRPARRWRSTAARSPR